MIDRRLDEVNIVVIGEETSRESIPQRAGSDMPEQNVVFIVKGVNCQ